MDKNLELYIHIPFCVRKCNYCDFLSFSADESTQRDYAKALIREIDYYGPLMGDRQVSAIYIGGGTPTWLDHRLLIEIIEHIFMCFHVLPEAEISMECNPGTVTRDKMESYRQVGINRLSIGLQSADNEELKLLGRIHTYEQFLKTYELARNAGFTNINVDLISGLPYQTAEKFANTLHEVIRLKPEHISAYTLIVEKGTPFYDTYKFDAVRQEAGMKTEVLPTEDEAYQIYKMTQYILKEAGFHQYEVSNYAKPGFECKHNVGYWTRQNYLGMGLGAASLMDNVRYTNISDLYSYIEKSKQISMKELEYEEVAEVVDSYSLKETECNMVAKKVLGISLHETGQVLERKAQIEEFMFLGLRMLDGVSRTEFEKAFGMPIEAVYRDVLNELKKEELLEVSAGQVYLTDKGMDLSNYAMAKFLL